MAVSEHWRTVPSLSSYTKVIQSRCGRKGGHACCEYAAFRLRPTGKARYEARYEARSEARGKATDDLSIMFLLRLYMTRLVLHFLGSKLSSASINHITNT